jgi:predicted nucleic acid-binding protein
MSIVVSDTSPIRALDHLGLLGLLATLYGRVIVPPAVADELRDSKMSYRTVEVEEFPFLEVIAPTRRDEVDRLRSSLDPGESEALVLATEISADLILIDERVGREVARQLSLPLIGTIGVLRNAKRQGLITALRPCLEDLVDNLGFFLSQKLIESVLREEGEV